MASIRRQLPPVPSAVCVAWVDAHSPDTAGWKSAADTKEYADDGAVIVYSFGAVLRDDDDVLILAGSVADDDGTDGLVAIPRECVLRVAPIVEMDAERTLYADDEEEAEEDIEDGPPGPDGMPQCDCD